MQTPQEGLRFDALCVAIIHRRGRFGRVAQVSLALAVPYQHSVGVAGAVHCAVGSQMLALGHFRGQVHRAKRRLSLYIGGPPVVKRYLV